MTRMRRGAWGASPGLAARGVRVGLLGVALLGACALELAPAPTPPVVARFDPEAGVIPLPTDVLLDRAAGHLDLPIETDMTPAEVAFRTYLNGLAGWSTTFPGKVEFSGPIARDSITADSLQLFEWSTAPRRLEWRWDDQPRPPDYEGIAVTLTAGGTALELDPPRAGWAPGGRYLAVLRGGVRGARDQSGRPVEVDAAFYYLRLTEQLDEYQYQRAFPGDTREARLEKGRELEEVRAQLAPFFAWLESASRPAVDRVPRDEVVALWSFTATTRTELCMDQPSQRMPLPFDLLVDPATGRVDLPPAAWDSATVADGKLQANRLDGFGVSPNLLFELSRAVDPASATPRTVRLYRLDDDPAEVTLAAVTVMSADGATPCLQTPVDPGCTQVVLQVAEAELPLRGRTTYAVVVHDGLRGLDGQPVVPMLVGHFMRAAAPLAVAGKSQLEAVGDEDAARLEGVRQKLDGFLTHLGRDDVVTAWPFTTLDAVPALRAALDRAAEVGTPADPARVSTRTITDLTRADAFDSLFPGALAAGIRATYSYRLAGVGKVVEGTITSPYFLDRTTRRWRTDGGYESEAVRFLMTVPASAKPGTPVPVVIFGHAIVTDRRFLLTIAGALAQKGFAAVAIDFPFHGDRLACIEASLVALPNFLSSELQNLLDYHDNLIYLPPCLSGAAASCSADGQCLDASGNPEPFNSFLTLAGKPAVMDMKPASGAAFMDIDDISHVNDHFVQALVDLGALKRSLRVGNWEAVLGVPLRTDVFYYAGQSLGAIIGAVYAAVDPDITRAVFNVPGADLVDLFVESVYFGPQIADYFDRHAIPPASFEHERLLDVARWLIDSVDPHTVAGLYRGSGRAALIQMDSGLPSGDVVIPNRTTRLLQRVSDLPVREYPSSLHGDLIVPLVGDQMLDDLAAFLAGEIDR